MQRCTTSPRTARRRRTAPRTFEAPHSNGAVHQPNRAARKHAPWEFMILSLFVADPVHRDHPRAGRSSARTRPSGSTTRRPPPLSAACDRGADQVEGAARIPIRRQRRRARRRAMRAENVLLQRDGRSSSRPCTRSRRPRRRAAGRGATDWGRMIDAARRATPTTSAKSRRQPNGQGALHLSGRQRDQAGDATRWTTSSARTHPRLDACFTEALQLEVVEGPREYKKVTT